MKSNIALLAATVALASSSAGASVIYSNGPYNGTVDAFNVVGSAGFDVANSFTASAGSVARSITFVTWSTAKPVSVNWSITVGNPDLSGSTPVANGTATISATLIGTNGFGFSLYSDTINLGNVDLTAGGAYWLDFSNGVVGDTGNLFWDANNGPSSAYQGGGGLGDLTNVDYGFGVPSTNSEAFTIFDTSAVPEPAAWALMLAGFAGLGAALRLRRARPAAA